MDNDKIQMYNKHAKLLAEIGLAITNGNKNILDINGFKEIVALYLLIPYITKDRLETPDDGCVIPYIEDNFIDNITLDDLRNTISHSFVTVEEDKHDGTMHGKYLIFDDRIITEKTNHSKLGKHSSCYYIMIDRINARLVELFTRIINGNYNK